MAVSSIQAGSGLYGISGSSRGKQAGTREEPEAATDTVRFSAEALELAKASARNGEPAGSSKAARPSGDEGKNGKHELKLEAFDEWGRRISGLSADNMRTLTQSLEDQLNAAFAKNGITVSPPVAFTVANGTIQATGKREDLEKITKLVNSDESLKETIESLAYVTEEMSSFVQEGHLAFSREYQASNDPEGVVKKYSHLFNGLKLPPSPSTISFGGSVSASWKGRLVSAEDFMNNPNWIDLV